MLERDLLLYWIKPTCTPQSPRHRTGDNHPSHL